MINDDERVLAVIPARGGSKGLPGKNLRPLGGRPLIAWSIEVALGVSRIDRLVVSSDDAEIRDAARAWGCATALERPGELAGDTVGVEPVLCQVADTLGECFEWVVLLQPTSPFRSPADVDGAVNLAAAGGQPVIGVTEPSKSPYWSFRMTDDGTLEPLIPGARSQQRQALPVAYAPNGAVYVARIEQLRETGTFYTAGARGYYMPPERAVDIDTALDLEFANFLLNRSAGPAGA